MRRLFSISAIIAVLASLAPTHMLMSCHANAARTVCHRTGTAAHTHHCEAMQEEAASAEESWSNLDALNVPSTCPMNCCFQLGSGNGTAIAAAQVDFQFPAVEYSFLSAQVVFAHSGFSSHTDRGPPAA